MTPIIILASVLGGASILLIFAAVALRPSSEMGQRMALYNAGAPLQLEALELREPFRERVLKPLALHMMRLFSIVLPNKRLGKLRHRLQLAGYPGGITAADFVGIKSWTTVFLALVVGLYLYASGIQLSLLVIAAAVIVVAIGYALPDIWLSRRITQRQGELLNAMPDALDMLTISVEAGLSFDQGLMEIASRWDHELALEFRRVLYEIGLGKTRREALDNLSERTEVPDIQSFVSAVNHAEELGTSMSRVLHVQSQDMRIRRRQRAQEAANKLPIKMLFPMVFLIFPALFAVILGPGVPKLLGSMGGLGG
jgi:tight adherence protein C